MTRDELMALHEIKLDAAVTEIVFGLGPCIEVSRRKGKAPYILMVPGKLRFDDKRVGNCEFGQRFTREGNKHYCGSPLNLYYLRSFSASLDAARLVEDEVERRGLKDAYIEELHKLIGVSWGMLWKELGWAIRRATPTQIARAALLALEAK